ncbi:hypothetical protein [Jannaschia marina]|uniref:hypothetical protein n=1 Tax=Jannaschia marina TaxID=2741674 RepID=UPI0015C90BFA|nr:hypothetical protein [Jannaschia marina]
MQKTTYMLSKVRRELRKAVNDITPPVVSRALNRNANAAGDRDRMNRERYRQRMEIDAGIADRLEYAPGQLVFDVPVSRLRYFGALPYTHPDHPMRRYYRDGAGALADYYARHQPRDIFERHFLPSPRADAPAEGLPWVEVVPMAGIGKDTGELALRADVHGVQHFGPVSDAKLAVECTRLDRIRASMAEKGFDPRFGFPNGYFLIGEGGDWAVVVQGGQHRAAALLELGEERVPLLRSPGTKTVIRRAEVEAWPMVRDGLLSRAEAEAIFDAFLSEDRTLTFADPAAREPAPE